jgi:23S rRNA pseudouridine1911/1915/1917 synthase
MNPTILYEDENILAINKPAGLIVHSDGRTEEATLTDWILKNYPELKEVGEPWENPQGEVIYRPGIVHRLDRETSGAMIIAKNQDAFKFLKEKFQTKDIKKTYKAFVYREINPPLIGALDETDEGIIDRPIGRSAKDFRMWSAQRGARGKLREALTKFKVLATGKGLSFVEANPLTGRTHQIRVHFKAINHPVLCDKLYAPKRECELGFERVALHSHKIKFTNLDGKEIEIEAPYPEDFERALENF